MPIYYESYLLMDKSAKGQNFEQLLVDKYHLSARSRHESISCVIEPA